MSKILKYLIYFTSFYRKTYCCGRETHQCKLLYKKGVFSSDSILNDFIIFLTDFLSHEKFYTGPRDATYLIPMNSEVLDCLSTLQSK